MNPKIDKNTKINGICNTCDSCNDILYIDNLHYQDGEILCDDCFSKKFVMCSICGDIISIDNAYNSFGNNYCESCYWDNFGSCENCGRIFHNDDLYWHASYESSFCESCNPPEIDGLHEYEYRPKPTYYRGINELENDDHRCNLYFGIELEIESDDNDIESAVKNLPDFVYAKEDSSVNAGFEIVSHPCTYKWLRENPEKWNQILDLRKDGFRSYNTDTCGIHIHLSKNYFGTWHLYKFLKLFYENPKFILRISQRNENNLNHWATLSQKHYNNNDDESLVYKAKNKQGNYERYTAVNLQNQHTIEIRIFKGTLNPRSFWKNIEFVKATVDFTLNATLKDVIVKKFEQFIVKHKSEYINLYNWMYKSGFYKDSLEE